MANVVAYHEAGHAGRLERQQIAKTLLER